MITPDRETQWTQVEQTMRFHDDKMRELIGSTEAERHTVGRRNTLEELRTYELFDRAHLDGLTELPTSFETLYTAMPDTRKVVADRVFQRFGRQGQRSNG